MEENIIPERGIKMILPLPPAFANSRGEKTVSSVLFEEIERIDIRGNILLLVRYERRASNIQSHEQFPFRPDDFPAEIELMRI